MGSLYLVRHAKSNWDTGVTDHERPLNRRGRRASAALGRWLARIDEVPELALTSTALRARETLDRARAAGSWSCRVEALDDLYRADLEDVVRVIAIHGGTAERLLVVGHQPTLGGVVHALTNAAVDLPTATVACIDLPDPWADLQPGVTGVLRWLLPGRTIEAAI